MIVLNRHGEGLDDWESLVARRVVRSMPRDVRSLLQVPGAHNVANAECAAAAAAETPCDDASIAAGLRAFRGLPQRLELVDEIDDCRFIDDSAATTPESAIAALHAIDGPLWLLAGGHNKGADLGPLTHAITRHARGVACYGEVRRVLSNRLEARGVIPCCSTEHLDDAFAWCVSNRSPGDAVVLSPGFSSHDQFINYRHRSERFRTLVDHQRHARVAIAHLKPPT